MSTTSTTRMSTFPPAARSASALTSRCNRIPDRPWTARDVTSRLRQERNRRAIFRSEQSMLTRSWPVGYRRALTSFTRASYGEGKRGMVHPRIDPTHVHAGRLRSSQGAVLDGVDHPRSRRSGSWMAPLRAAPGSPRGARCRAGPAHVEEVTAPVTPCRRSPGPTVRDACGCTRGSAACGSDVSGTDEVAVAPVPAVRAGEPASPRLGDGPVALRAGGGRPLLVHEHDLDPHQLRLVRQAPQQMGAPPIAQRQVLATPAVSGGDALGIP